MRAVCEYSASRFLAGVVLLTACGPVDSATEDAQLAIPTPAAAVPAPTPLLGSDLSLALSWDSAVDLDLHLVNETAGGTFAVEPWDCFYASANPNWGDLGNPYDDPLLHGDVVDGSAPEFITMNRQAGDAPWSYAIFAHFRSTQSVADPVTAANVQVAAYGTILFDRTMVLPTSALLWTVARIEFPGVAFTPIDSIGPAP